MFDSFKKLFKHKDNTSDDNYIFVSKSEFNEELKSNIIALEKLGEHWSTSFKETMSHNLKATVSKI